jgi:FtsZ-binding cell division protein ZapB
MVETPYHDYKRPDKGTEDWHQPLNNNFGAIDADIEVRDSGTPSANNYDPKQGAKYLDTTSGVVYVGELDNNDDPIWTPAFALAGYDDSAGRPQFGPLGVGTLAGSVTGGTAVSTLAGSGLTIASGSLGLASDSVTVAGNSVSLGGSTDISHADLSSISADQHHAKDHDHTEGDVSAVPNNGLANSSVTVAGNSVSLGGSAGISHADLSSIGSSDHHTRPSAGNALADNSNTFDVEESSIDHNNLTNSGQADAHHTRPSAGSGLAESSNTFAVSPSAFAGTYLSDDGSGNLTVDAGNGLEDDDSGNLQAALGNALGFDGSNRIAVTTDSVTVAGNSVSLGGSTGISHADLGSVSADQHHAKDHEHTESGVSTVPNAGLTNSSLSVAGNSVSLGGSTGVDYVDLGDTGSSFPIPNADLANSSVTVTSGDGLKNGGSASLGSSTTLDVEPSDFAGSALEDDGSDNLAVSSGGITTTELASGAVTSTEIADGTIATADVGQNGAADGHVLRWNGSNTEWETGFPGTTGDMTPFELQAGGTTTLTLDPNGFDAPNAIVGTNHTTFGEGVTVGGGQGNTVYDDWGTVSGGTGNQAGSDDGDPQIPDNADYATVSGGDGNTASDSHATVSGGEGHTASGSHATVSGGDGNTASGGDATVGGGFSNQASGNTATIAGGGQATASQSYATVGGGNLNEATAQEATVSGGESNVASGSGAVIGGGNNNEAGGSNATIGGGQENAASATYATVGGGSYNDAAAKYAAIAGGGPTDEFDQTNTNNVVYDNYGTIGGGGNNQAGSDDGDPQDPTNAPYATVAGGKANTANADLATVAGGANNTASATGATVAGGGTDGINSGNEASGKAATVGGGNNNTASGFGATVPGGQRGAAEDDKSFVWNDGTGYHAIPNSNFDGLSSNTAVDGEPVTGANTFSVSATGGVRFITGSASNPNVTYIPNDSAGWTTTSSRAVKTNIDPVDPEDALAGVEEMEVTTWEYDNDGDGAGTTHIGPMAGDFHEAFDVGSSDEHINSINADGVAFAAIQGLSAKLDERDERIADLEADNEQKDERIETLERENERLRERNTDLETRIAAIEDRLDIAADSESSP